MQPIPSGSTSTLLHPRPVMAELILGLDFGTSKIGVAVGQHLTATASPIGKVRASQGKPNWVAMDRIIREWQPNLLVVGLPLNMDSSRGDMVEAAWGNQIRNYVFHPYQMVKDLRTEKESTDVEGVMNGDLDLFIQSLLLQGVDNNGNELGN